MSIIDEIKSGSANSDTKEAKSKKFGMVKKTVSTGSRRPPKDKSVCLYINSKMYEQFTEICAAMDLSRNDQICKLIAAFIDENDRVLEEA